eukprot:3633789-Pyramimonas_sp.AAC.1
MERLGHMPAPLHHILLAMIPRDDGGRRPIGVLQGNIRIFGRLSRFEAKRWEEARPRSYLFGSKGRSCERAIWGQS